VQSRHISLKSFKISQVYCVLKAYIDESYDNFTMCVGGWLCDERAWNRIENKWTARIEHERRMSIRRGEEPILRYHATDCANLKRQYATWTIDRQIRFTKRLIGILGSESRPRPVGIAAGLSMRELRAVRPDLSAIEIKRKAYFLCMCECLLHIGAIMDGLFPTERVMIIHDRSLDFDHQALSAFNDMLASRKFRRAHYFVSIAAGSSKDFLALQPADLIAYEGFKLTAARKRGSEELRKSLQKVLGHGIIISAGFFEDHGLKELCGG
jgi:hypothetical protein